MRRMPWRRRSASLPARGKMAERSLHPPPPIPKVLRFFKGRPSREDPASHEGREAYGGVEETDATFSHKY